MRVLLRRLFPWFSACLFLLAAGWGSIGHRIINKNFSQRLPSEMNFLSVWSDTLAAHASDADTRKGSDPNEGRKHYIDIDSYPEFLTTGRIKHNYDSLVIQHGLAFVLDKGTLPWSINIAVDSLTQQFRRKDWRKASLTASDLGHYIGDGHMPLHITENYDGQLTGQSGVHSRYESTMIGRYSSSLVYAGDTVVYIADRLNHTFGFLYQNYRLVDSVLYADSLSKVMAVGQYNTTYYQKLWEMTKDFTLSQFRLASKYLASYIFTAWTDAGKPDFTTGTDSDIITKLLGYYLGINYPNPFNPETKFQFHVPVATDVSVEVYDANGNKVAELMNGRRSAGSYSVAWKPGSIVSGVYYYVLKTPAVRLTKKMVYLK